MARRQPNDEWAEIDAELIAWRITTAVARIQTARRCSYRDALRIVRARYDELRHQAPGRFTASPEEFWEGFRIDPRPAASAIAKPRVEKSPSSEATQPRAVRRARGERRIVVDEVAYFWRIPPKPNESQRDLVQGIFAVIRRVDGQAAPFAITFPRDRLDVSRDAAPIRPAEVANAIREFVSRK